MSALAAIMLLPLCAFRTNRMIASHIRRCLCTAILTHFAVKAYLNTILTFTAFIADICAVRAIFAAVNAKVISTVTAVIAVAAHYIGTVNAYSAVGAKLVNAAGALTAPLTNIFRAVTTNYAAPLTDFSTVAAKLAVLTPHIAHTFAADITRSTEFVRTVGAFFVAVRTHVRTVFAALAARTYKSTIGA